MNINLYINSLLGPCLVFFLIALDYTRKFNTDPFKRFLFLVVLTAAGLATVADFVNRTVEGLPGPGASRIFAVAITVFYIAQNVSYYLMVVFLDYFAHQDRYRARKLLLIMAALLGASALLDLANLRWHFFFSLSPGNYYMEGPLYWLRAAISYFSMVLLAADAILIRKHFLKSQVFLLISFIILNALGSLLDLFLPGSDLIWPCYAAALLYIYLFIIQTDSKIDSLTGIENRLAFNEFISNLARGQQPWHIVMMDLDHFKQVNDTLGHAQGDMALRDMASIIKGCIRRTDFAARYGGDEFIVAIRAEYNIDRLMERIQQAMEHQNEKEGRRFTLRMSYGTGIFPGDSGESMLNFMARIDAQMYEHKKAHYRERDCIASGSGISS